MSDPAFIASSASSAAGSDADFDVVIVGASLAGCAAAMLSGQAGLDVALLERNREPDDYKQLCTHFIQPSAGATLHRLGVEDALLAAGAVRNRIDVILPWARTGEPPAVDSRGRSLVALNLRRSKLDPILRKTAAATPGVTMMRGVSVSALLRSGERIVGVETRGERSGPLRARLVVAADGRESAMARLAGAPLKRSPNGRFGCFAHYRGLDLARPSTSLMWLHEPLVAYLFPNDDGVSVAGCMPPKARLEEFRDDPGTALEALYATLPGAPRLDPARRQGRALLVKDYPNQWREPVHQGMALIGDAAMSIDPLWGVGCGWALQSAEWLVDASAEVLRERAAERDVQHLQPAAGAEHGHPPAPGLPHERHLELVPLPQGRVVRLVRRLPVELGVEVAAARHEEAVDAVEQALRILQVHREGREEDRGSPGLLDRGQVAVRDAVGEHVDPGARRRVLPVGHQADERGPSHRAATSPRAPRAPRAGCRRSSP